MDQFTDTIVDSLQSILSIGIQRIPGIIGGLIILFFTRYVTEFSQKIVHEIAEKTIKNRSLQILADKASYVGIWIVGVLFACVISFPGLRLGDIIATLGIGSIAIGFAFQDIVKNFLAGIIILVEEPFRIGDEISINGYDGVIKNINIRTTHIRTYQGEKVLLPNADVFTDAVKVKTAYDARRTDLEVGVDYHTPLPIAKKILQETINDLNGVFSEPPPEIDLVNFGDSSIDFILRYWTAPQQRNVRRIQTDAIVAIKEALDEANIRIPYPIRTLHYYDQDKYDQAMSIPSKVKDKVA
ncbi:mechanosensitive ion channel family protein [[Leptolyngbya] sp. PCC 7376]|uniref:mechanosensitive ion channel family protein n=1 Tax=[Leptolyngbya] sp. PCC 7376 TaxID=111781 RepID=UPI0003200AD1|nr:mechanosensitive ion channel family protein [[Leptolyngbya] sp. PCC 7376]